MYKQNGYAVFFVELEISMHSPQYHYADTNNQIRYECTDRRHVDELLKIKYR